MADLTFQLAKHDSIPHENGKLLWETYEYECGCKRTWIVDIQGTVVEILDWTNCQFHWYIESF